MSYYLEDPFGRIVDVHWKKKDEPPPPDRTPAFCNSYGWGTVVGPSLAGSIGAVPGGPMQFIPMTGTYSTEKSDPVYGGMIPKKAAMLRPVDTITAPPDGMHAINIRLFADSLVFSNAQLIFIPDDTNKIGAFRWIVPMVGGYTADGIPLVIQAYEITVGWQGGSDPADQVGLGFSHQIPNSLVEQRAPPVPAVVLGSAAGGITAGTRTYIYDFKYKEWRDGQIRVTVDNQYDPNLGGPATLWWMVHRQSGGVYQPWRGTVTFMDSVLVGLGDQYHWSIAAKCQPMPPTSPVTV